MNLMAFPRSRHRGAPRGARSDAHRGAHIALLASTAGAGTVDAVRERGVLRCGVNGEVRGMSLRDDNGHWSGLDTDFCRAVATAVLDDPNAVEFVPVGSEERFAVVRDGKVDLLARNTTWTGLRDITEGVSFAGVLYYDGQGFMVPRKTNTLSALELGGAKVCAIAGSTSIDNAKRYFTRNRMSLQVSVHPDLTSAAKAYLDGQCTALTSDRSQLHALRAGLDDPAAQRILPESISKEPLGPVVRDGDQQWFDLVRWTLFTLVEAEELGINSGNVTGAMEHAESDEVRALLDLDGTTAKVLGNYGELFGRNLGAASGLDVKRGLNAQWSAGGLMYAPPAR